MYATAEIDLARPAGRRIAREMERHPKVVRMNYPQPDNLSGKWYTLDEGLILFLRCYESS